MSHQEKQEIFDRYAEQLMAPDFNHLMFWCAGKNRLEHIFAACDLVQEEQQKRIIKKFCELINNYQLESVYLDDCLKIKNLITNPENIIK